MNRDLRILMLEHSPTDANLAEHELRKAGLDFTSLRVETLGEFVQSLDKFHPDIVLSDYKLADFDGKAALEIVRREYPEIPVIVVTRALFDIEAVEMMHKGAKDYVLKDGLARLAPAVQRALAAEQGARARKAAEQALRESEAKLRLSHTLLDNASDAIAVIDPATLRFVDITQTVCRDLGYSREELLSMSISDIDHAFKGDAIRVILERMRQSGGGARFESVHRRKDGSTFPVEVSAKSIELDRDYVLLIVRDLTKRAEESERELEERYRFLFENMIEGYAYGKILYEHGIPVDFIYLFINGRFEELSGLHKENVVGKKISEVIPGVRESNPEWLEALRTVASSGKPEKFESYEPYLGHWLSISVYCLSSEYFVAIFEDITERKKTEYELRLAAITFESREGMMVTDANVAVIRVNPSFTRITGYTAEEVIGKNPHILSPGLHDAQFYQAIWKCVDETGAWEGDFWDRRKNCEIYPAHLTVTAVKNGSDVVTNYVVTFSDISASQAAAKEIKHLAYYDFLTGLPNRRLLIDRLQQVMAASVRSGETGALLFMDLDDFKIVNDTLGHEIGDMLLKQVAQRLGACVREGDTVARFGGDEFMVMLEDLSAQTLDAAAQTEAIGEQILAALNEPYELAGHVLHCTPSIGATLFSEHHWKVDDLFKQADIAMYQAKKAGRNTLRFFDPQVQEVISARAILERELRKALENHQFKLYYQLQVDSLHRPLGAEALIRWIHPEHGLIAPAKFIPLAEETGLILPIGLWVLDSACARLKAWQQYPLTRELVLAVNVSAKQFRQPDFVNQVQRVLQSYAINPLLLKLELTESILLENIEDTIATMKTLRAMDVKCSLDDFGTGYSSLQYLKRLPLDQLKIDQSFIQDVIKDNSDRAIVRTIIAMAASLKLDVIAEGVETEEQRQFLLDNGCINFQGWLFGEAMPIEHFDALLHSKNDNLNAAR